MKSCRETIDVPRARDLYDQLRNWRLVAARMRRKSGQRFTADAILRSVRNVDRARKPSLASGGANQ